MEICTGKWINFPIAIGSTNDDDFVNLLNFKGYPPKIVLLRTGNQSNQYIEAILIKHKDNIHSFYDNNDIGLLEIF